MPAARHWCEALCAVGYPYQTSPEWERHGGSFTVDAGAVYMRVQLINYLNSGWVALRFRSPVPATQVQAGQAFDDISLRARADGGEHPEGTRPGGGGVDRLAGAVSAATGRIQSCCTIL